MTGRDLNKDRIDGLSKRVHQLETEIDVLKKLILRVHINGPHDDKDFRGWEIMNVLHNWAQRES